MLASVAYEAQIINGAFFTALVLTAILTSQAAGVWLGFVLRRGWTLLRDDMPDLPPRAVAPSAAERDLQLQPSGPEVHAASGAGSGPSAKS